MTVRLYDSHCHLQDAEFSPDREEVYQRARQEGLGLLVPGYTMESSKAAVQFVNAHQETWALVGVHPHDSKDFIADDRLTLRQWVLDEPKVVGVGEIGLDYHYRHSPEEVQKSIFEDQLCLARELNVPVSVHTREAEEDTLAIIQRAGWHRGVIHCFTGTADFARHMLELGWYISFSGVVTFKSADALRAIAEWVPMDRLLIETDAPYLSPAPWRGQRNEPIHVLRVAEVIAQQKNYSTKEVYDATMSNVNRLFFLP